MFTRRNTLDVTVDIIPIPGFSEPFSSLSHLLAAGVFLVLMFITMYKGRGSWPRLIGIFIFGFFTVVLFSLSGVFHLLQKGTDASYVLKILDHTAIYTMIAGSFTPFHMILMRGAARWLPLLVIWLIAVTGLTLTAIFFDGLSESLLLAVFLAMGWMGAFTIFKVWRIAPQTGKLIAVGCVFYTLGAVADFAALPLTIPGVFAAHELFHVLIVIAALCHWKAIYDIAHFPVQNKMKVLVTEQPEHLKAYLFGKHYAVTATNRFELKRKLSHWLKQNYPPTLLPKQIKFEFAKEEWVNL